MWWVINLINRLTTPIEEKRYFILKTLKEEPRVNRHQGLPDFEIRKRAPHLLGPCNTYALLSRVEKQGLVGSRKATDYECYWSNGSDPPHRRYSITYEGEKELKRLSRRR